MTITRVAVVGGGLSGLSAAFELERAGIRFELFEASSRLGGNVKSTTRDGFLIEHGADSWIAYKPWLEELARDLGMEDEIVASPAVFPSTSILKGSELVPLPRGLKLFVPSDLKATDGSRLFSPATKQRFHQEREYPPEPLAPGHDETVSAFVERHFGREVVDTLAAPLLAGVYGGDADRLSARAVIPGIVEMEANFSSLVQAAQEGPSSDPSQGIFRTFRGGMQSVIDELSHKVPAEHVHLTTSVLKIVSEVNSCTLHTERCEYEGFSHVVLALPVPVVAKVLGLELPQIQYSSVATVALAYDVLPQLPPGFGFLVATGERCPVMAATFVHQKWPARVPAGKSLIRVFVADPEMLAASDDTIVRAVQKSLASILELTAAPLFTAVDRWPHSMPQFEVGHVERVLAIRKTVEQSGRFFLAGNSYDGVGMPDAVRTGRNAVRAICAQSLGK